MADETRSGRSMRCCPTRSARGRGGRVRSRSRFAHLSSWSIDVGRDRVCSVSLSYWGEFPFPEDTFERLTFGFLSEAELEELVEMAMRTA